MSRAATLLRAAELLEADAEALLTAHTLDGRWVLLDDADHEAQKLHSETLFVAGELRAMAA